MQHNSPLHRVFAVSTFADFLLTLFLTFTLSLLTFTPSLSQPFGSFLCSSIMSSDYSPISSTGGSLHERESTRGGIEILLWGVEACEESWRSGMVKIIAGCVVAAALRVYGVWVSWEMNSEIRDEELRKQGEAWIDTDTETSSSSTRGGGGEHKTASRMEETLSRSRSVSSTGQGSARRSNTLPATGVLPPRYTDQPRPRSQSSSYPPSGASSSNRPRLVLLPVYVDNQGNPIYSPTSPSYPYPPGSSPPAYSLPPRRSRSKTSSSFSSSSSSASRSPSRSKPLSSVSPPPKTSSSFRTRSYSSSSSSSTSSSAPLTSSPNKITLSLPPHYTDEPLSLSSSPTATSSSLLKSQEGAQRTRRSRNRSDTDVLLASLPEITV